LLLVNLPLLASLEKRSTHRELTCFFGVENKKLATLKEDDLADKTAKDIFALF